MVAEPDDSTVKNGSAGPTHGFAASPPPAGAAPKRPESTPPVVGLAREASGGTMADLPAGATDQLAKTRPDEPKQDERVPGRYRTSFDWSDLSAPRFGPLRPEPIEQAGPAQVVLHGGAAPPATDEKDSATGNVLDELALLPGRSGGSGQEEYRDASAGEQADAPPGPRAEEIHRRMERALSEMARRGETQASFTFLVDVQDRAIITSAHPIGARTGDIRIERAVVAWLVGARIEPALPPGSGRLIALQISVEAPSAGMN
ncbi:MAG TPA: hypothetical protein VFP98_02030, partial [Candidatus Polarisedimenticolia bacterium]|nr:hypothetical protein [Candidatus Polarisedimenticolia bacterium]